MNVHKSFSDAPETRFLRKFQLWRQSSLHIVFCSSSPPPPPPTHNGQQQLIGMYTLKSKTTHLLTLEDMLVWQHKGGMRAFRASGNPTHWRGTHQHYGWLFIVRFLRQHLVTWAQKKDTRPVENYGIWKAQRGGEFSFLSFFYKYL